MKCQILKYFSLGDNLHEMSNLIFLEKYFKMLSAEMFTQHAKLSS